MNSRRKTHSFHKCPVMQRRGDKWQTSFERCKADRGGRRGPSAPNLLSGGHANQFRSPKSFRPPAEGKRKAESAPKGIDA